jgi:SAM-dependent methyltransferase
VDIVLDALSAMGLLKKQNDTYQNTDLVEKHLVTGCDSMMMFSIDHSEQIYRRWANLPEAVKDGQPHGRDESHVVGDAESNRVFIRAMHARGLDRGRKIATALNLDGVHRVADIGGGAGSYLIALAEQISGLDATLFDLNLTLQNAREIIEEHDPSLKIKLVEDDIFKNTKPFGDDFDLVLLSNIIHIVGPEENIALLKRIRHSLAPGGRLVIQDFLLDETATEPQGAALFAVVMLVSTETGRAWRERDVRQWLQEAGFTDVQRLDAGTDSDILVAS